MNHVSVQTVSVNDSDPIAARFGNSKGSTLILHYAKSVMYPKTDKFVHLPVQCATARPIYMYFDKTLTRARCCGDEQ